MIPFKSILSNTTSWFAPARSYIVAMLLITTVAAVGVAKHQTSRVKKLDLEVGRLNNIQLELNSNLNESANKTRVLELTVDELNRSNDEQLHRIDSLSKALKINQKKLDYATSVKSSYIDTIRVKVQYIDTVMPKSNCDFAEVTKEMNDLTKISASMTNGELSIMTDIGDNLTAFIYRKSVYRNPNKSFFRRLFSWDWKKDEIQEGSLWHENERIKYYSFRIMKGKK